MLAGSFSFATGSGRGLLVRRREAEGTYLWEDDRDGPGSGVCRRVGTNLER